MSSNDALDRFVLATKSVDYENSLKSIENYFENIQRFYVDKSDCVTPLVTVHKRVVEGELIGIVAINTAWRSVGDSDEGKSLFPIALLKDALKKNERD